MSWPCQRRCWARCWKGSRLGTVRLVPSAESRHGAQGGGHRLEPRPHSLRDKFRHTMRTLRKHDLAGKRFGNLLVIRRIRDPRGKVRWRCKCSCGAPAQVVTQDLVRTDGRAIRRCRRCSYRERARARELPLQEFKARLRKLYGDQVSLI